MSQMSFVSRLKLKQNGNMNPSLKETSNFLLDKKRFRVKHCPCGKDNKDGKFVPFVGFENQGYCHSCGESFFPETIDKTTWNKAEQIKKSDIKINVIPNLTYQKFVGDDVEFYNQNHFIQWLGNKNRLDCAFDNYTIVSLIKTYCLGNSDNHKYKGWVLFPYIDIEGKIREIKAINYDSESGKRIKVPNNQCWFIGKEILNNKDANTKSCFYGEHLLKGNNKPVKIFESEATATYVSPFYPESTCIATGGTNGNKWIDEDKCHVLKDKSITLYPDIDAHESWVEKSKILKRYGLKVQVSTLIKDGVGKFAEQNGMDINDLIKQKFDLRDILKHQNLQKFHKSFSFLAPLTTGVESLIEEPKHDFIEKNDFENNLDLITIWRNKILDLESFFYSRKLPTEPIKLNGYTTILNPSKFIESHFLTLRANMANDTFSTFFERLVTLKKILLNEID